MTSKEIETPHADACASPDTDELVKNCCSGDRSAQHQLYELYHSRVHRLATRVVGRDEADDVVQQVFLQLFRKIDQFRGQAKFDTWLYKVATNEALQFLRKKQHGTFEALAVDPAGRKDTGRERREDRELLEAALARLDAELRAIFILKELENLSYRDIAGSVGIPEGTVGSRLNRARRELRRHLADLGWEA